MNRITRADIERAEIDNWITGMKKRLKLAIHNTLSEEKPLGLPIFLETEFESHKIRVKIRVDFSEDHGAANRMQIKRPVSLESWNAMNKEWKRDGIKLVAGFWAAMLILGGLLYWLLVIIR